MQQLFAFGINHQTAPLDVREQVSFGPESVGEALRDLVEHESVREAAIVSTCNRTEVYCSTSEPERAVDWLARFHRLKAESLQPFVYLLPREQAVHHAFRVASGLDSMVLGEPQILGQMKEAVRSAEVAGTLGTVLHKLFAPIPTSARVRCPWPPRRYVSRNASTRLSASSAYCSSARER
jgi:glutamyl-tRNA reductase